MPVTFSPAVFLCYFYCRLKIIRIIINWQMVYSSVSSTEQMAQISHRVERKNKTVLPLAQGHTKDGDQQDHSYLPEQIRSAVE